MLRQVHAQVVRARHSRNRLIVVISCALLLTFVFSCVSAFASDDSGDPVEPVTKVDTEVLRISASQTNGFHAVVLGLLGDYNPIAVTTTYQYPSGNTYQNRQQVDVEPDWSWICSAAIFALIIFCLFRLVGGIFSWKR